MPNRFEATPRIKGDGHGGFQVAKLTFEHSALDLAKGLDLSGWFINGRQNGMDSPTEREAVAAIFQHILNNYTTRDELEIGDEVQRIEEGIGNYYEILNENPLGFHNNRLDE